MSLNVTTLENLVDVPPVLHLTDVGKEYHQYGSPRERFKALLLGGKRYTSRKVLQHISFELRRGQCLGVVGNNGAGKSTLLKLIAGTLRPSTGVLRRNGRVTAILELGAGFHPEFTGRENMFFSGQLIGISESEIHSLANSIIDFSELGDAIDRPVKTYSSGMTVRLAFALVTAIEPDLLIVDEALAVGDQHFQSKCIERIEAFRRNGCTILFCSHSMYHVRHLCDVALWLDQGKVKSFGETEHVLADYEGELHHEKHLKIQESQDMVAAQKAELKSQAEQAGVAHTGSTPEMGENSAVDTPPESGLGTRAKIVKFEIANLAEPVGDEPPLLMSPDLTITMTAQMYADERPNMGFMVEQAKGSGVTMVATHVDGVTPTPLGNGLWQATVTFHDSPLRSGNYVLSAYLFDAGGLVVYDEWMRGTFFKVIFRSVVPGLVNLPHRWS